MSDQWDDVNVNDIDEEIKKKLHQAVLNSVYGVAAIGSKPPTDLVVMSPTIQRAIREFESFVSFLKSSKWKTILKRADWIQRRVELSGGHRIYFKGETEGERALIGLHAIVVSIDEFLKTTEKEVSHEPDTK